MQPSEPVHDAAESVEGNRPPSRIERLLDGLRDMGDRTWEAELVLSAGVTFALIQLPGLLDGAFLRLDARLGGAPLLMVTMLYTYMKLALFVTIAVFVVHLVSRAYWIALIGLHSAFPDGIRWENTQYGPIGREEYPRLTPSLQTLIRDADRFGSSLFAFAFVMSAGFILPLLWIPPLMLAVLALRRWVLPDARIGVLLLGIGSVLVGTAVLAGFLDKIYARRRPGPRMEGFIRRAYRFNYRAFGQRLYGPLSLTIFTNTPKRVMYPVALVFTGALLVIFLGDMIADRGGVDLNSAEYVPRNAGAAEINPRYYENLIDDPLRAALAPSIESDIVTGPYLRLFLPYNPDRDSEWIAQRCPDLPAADRSVVHIGRRPDPPPDAVVQRHLGCVAGLWTVAINGDTIAPDVSFFRHPRTGARGLVSYVPAESLETGRNVLFLQRPRAMPDEGEEPEPPVRYWIPFWR